MFVQSSRLYSTLFTMSGSCAFDGFAVALLMALLKYRHFVNAELTMNTLLKIIAESQLITTVYSNFVFLTQF